MDEAARRRSLDRVNAITELAEQAGWRQQGRFQYRLANTLSDLGAFEAAIAEYERALGASSADEDVPIRALEQLANLEARQGERLGGLGDGAGEPDRGTTSGDRGESRALLQSAARHIATALAIHRTPERLAIAGAIQRRLAAVIDAVGDPAARERALRKAADAYREAYRLGAEAQHIDPYHGLAWIDLEILLRDRSTPPRLQVVRSCRSRAEALCDEQLTYWHRVSLPDADKSLALAEGKLAQRKDAIVRGYADAFSLGATRRERDSTLGYLRWLAAMLAWRGQAENAAVLREIAGDLDGA